MAYTVNKSNGDEIIVQDNTLNTDTSLYLVGKNFAGYGEYIAEDLVYLLEHFSNDNPPANPTAGQIWFDTTVNAFKSYDGTAWSSLSLETIGTITILDTDSVLHTVSALKDNNKIMAVISDEAFDVNTSDILYSSFASIGIGMTLTTGSKMHGTATTAEYADLAEMYKSDDMYVAGTVVKIGGEYEVTKTSAPYSDEVFGIVSTDPAYLMNSKCSGVAVALEGRVPCKVVGKVQKGDRLVASDIPGVAMVGEKDKVTWMNQVGRALEDKHFEEVGLVEVVVGAK